MRRLDQGKTRAGAPPIASVTSIDASKLAKRAKPENLGFLRLDPRFASAPYFSGYIIPRVSSRNSNRWKAVKCEVSINGSPAIIRMRLLVELPATEARLRESLPGEVGHHADACWN